MASIAEKLSTLDLELVAASQATLADEPTDPVEAEPAYEADTDANGIEFNEERGMAEAKAIAVTRHDPLQILIDRGYGIAPGNELLDQLVLYFLNENGVTESNRMSDTEWSTLYALANNYMRNRTSGSAEAVDMCCEVIAQRLNKPVLSLTQVTARPSPARIAELEREKIAAERKAQAAREASEKAADKARIEKMKELGFAPHLIKEIEGILERNPTGTVNSPDPARFQSNGKGGTIQTGGKVPVTGRSWETNEKARSPFVDAACEADIGWDDFRIPFEYFDQAVRSRSASQPKCLQVRKSSNGADLRVFMAKAAGFISKAPKEPSLNMLVIDGFRRPLTTFIEAQKEENIGTAVYAWFAVVREAITAYMKSGKVPSADAAIWDDAIEWLSAQEGLGESLNPTVFSPKARAAGLNPKIPVTCYTLAKQARKGIESHTDETGCWEEPSDGEETIQEPQAEQANWT